MEAIHSFRILLFIVSGFYNFARAIPGHKGDGLYHALLGTKILLALILFAISSALVGRSKAFEISFVMSLQFSHRLTFGDLLESWLAMFLLHFAVSQRRVGQPILRRSQHGNHDYTIWETIGWTFRSR